MACIVMIFGSRKFLRHVGRHMRGHEKVVTFDNAIGVGIALCCAIPVLGRCVITLFARHSHGLLAV